MWYHWYNLSQEERLMMRFPITDLLEEQECYNYLLRTLHTLTV